MHIKCRKFSYTLSNNLENYSFAKFLLVVTYKKMVSIIDDVWPVFSRAVNDDDDEECIAEAWFV